MGLWRKVQEFDVEGKFSNVESPTQIMVYTCIITAHPTTFDVGEYCNSIRSSRDFHEVRGVTSQRNWWQDGQDLVVVGQFVTTYSIHKEGKISTRRILVHQIQKKDIIKAGVWPFNNIWQREHRTHWIIQACRGAKYVILEATIHRNVIYFRKS